MYDKIDPVRPEINVTFEGLELSRRDIGQKGQILHNEIRVRNDRVSIFDNRNVSFDTLRSMLLVEIRELCFTVLSFP